MSLIRLKRPSDVTKAKAEAHSHSSFCAHVTLFWPPPLPPHLLLCVPNQFTYPVLLATSEPRLSRRPWHCPIFPVQKESLPAHHSSSSVWDDAHFPLRPGVWFPKLWVPYYHVLISASPILPNKVILWRCGSLRKQTHQHMV